MNCRQCNANLPERSRFCVSCGTPRPDYLSSAHSPYPHDPAHAGVLSAWERNELRIAGVVGLVVLALGIVWVVAANHHSSNGGYYASSSGSTTYGTSTDPGYSDSGTSTDPGSGGDTSTDPSCCDTSSDTPTDDPTPSDSPSSVGMVDISEANSDSRAQAIGQLLDNYYSGINSKNYDQALNAYDPAGNINPNDDAQRQHFIEGVQSSSDSDVVLTGISDLEDGSGDVAAHVTFQSQQDPANSYNNTGSCTSWQLDWILSTPDNGDSFLILRSDNVSASSC